MNNLNYLQEGNERQKLAYNAIENSGVIACFAEFNPTLCGTLPLGIDIEGSDLDIIMEVHDFKDFEKKAAHYFGGAEGFRMKRLLIREVPSVKANFLFQGFEFELFGQPLPVYEQYAYLHMMIEEQLLNDIPNLKEQVMELRKKGHKTEPAFCIALGIEGDSYEGLIKYGKDKGII